MEDRFAFLLKLDKITLFLVISWVSLVGELSYHQESSRLENMQKAEVQDRRAIGKVPLLALLTLAISECKEEYSLKMRVNVLEKL